MKYIIRTLSILVLIFAGVSCDDRLEELRPEDALSPDVVFTDAALIDAATVGVYSVLEDGNSNGGPQYSTDFMADDVSFVGSFPTLQDIRDYNINATNGTVFGYWFEGYEDIRATNNILVNLPEVNVENVLDLTEELKSQYIAEARFVRALVHFNLVNWFGQPYQVSNGNTLGVPIVTEFFEGDITTFQKPRNSVAEVYDFVEDELLLAIADLPVDNGIRAKRASAEALLSRVYLYKGEWEQAAIFATRSLDSPSVELAPDLSFYNQPSSEHIFQAINTPNDPSGGNPYDTFYNPGSLGGRGDLPMSQSLIDAYNEEPMDLRFTSLSVVAEDAGSNANAVFTQKYPNPNTGESDANILRAAEMHLNRAEANFNNGSSIGDSPLNDINAIRDRAGLGALTSVDLDIILNERRKELAFEGHRRMDLLRNSRNLRPDDGAVSAFGANRTIFPIPQVELTRNPNMEQSPGY